MRKPVIALVAAITLGAIFPAAAQVGSYAAPGGMSVAVGPGYFVYGQFYPWPYQRHFHHRQHAPYGR